jgi:hypothetical protein
MYRTQAAISSVSRSRWPRPQDWQEEVRLRVKKDHSVCARARTRSTV